MKGKNYIQPLATAYIATVLTLLWTIVLALVGKPALILIINMIVGIILSTIVLWFYWPRGE
jgi:hypothetical protein